MQRSVKIAVIEDVSDTLIASIKQVNRPRVPPVVEERREGTVSGPSNSFTRSLLTLY